MNERYVAQTTLSRPPQRVNNCWEVLLNFIQFIYNEYYYKFNIKSIGLL